MFLARRYLGFKISATTAFVVIVSSTAQLMLIRMGGEQLSLTWHLIAILLLIAIALLVAWFFAHTLVTDVNRLRNAAKLMSQGEWVKDTGVRSIDQIGELARTFEQMSTQIHTQTKCLQDARDRSDEQRARLEAILDMAADGIITIYREPNGSVVRSFNKKACEMFGVSPELVEHRPYREVVRSFIADSEGHPIEKDVELERLTALVDGLDCANPYGQIELRGRRSDGTWFPMVVSIGQGEVRKSDTVESRIRKIPLVTLIIRDVTEQKRYEETLRDHNAQLTRLNTDLETARRETEQAMKAQEVFMANLSHDLRTPLTIVLGYSEELLEQSTRGDPIKHDDLRLVVTASKELMELIRDSSNYFKLRHGDKLVVNAKSVLLPTLFDNYRLTLDYLARKRSNTFVAQDLDAVGKIVTDRYFLWRILMNLVSNACKFTENGTVTLKVNREYENGVEWVCFRVTDTGIGVPENAVKSLFTRYQDIQWSGSRGRTGFGIGLHICRMYSEILGGSVCLERTTTEGEQRGSTFLLKIPATYASQQPLPKNMYRTQIKREKNDETNPRLVLVIEDDQHYRDLISKYLLELGYRVELATNGLHGLDLARNCTPSVIILDIKLPDFDGWSVLAALKEDERTKFIPVLMLTVVDDHARATILGAEDYLLKPISADAVTNAVKRLLPGQTRTDWQILVVGPRETVRRVRQAMQPSPEGMQFRYANTLESARVLINDWLPNLLLLDPRLPDEGGTALLDWLGKYENQLVAQIPTILLSDTESTEVRKRYTQEIVSILTHLAVERDGLLNEIRKHLNKIEDRSTMAPLARNAP